MRDISNLRTWARSSGEVDVGGVWSEESSDEGAAPGLGGGGWFLCPGERAAMRDANAWRPKNRQGDGNQYWSSAIGSAHKDTPIWLKIVTFKNLGLILWFL